MKTDDRVRAAMGRLVETAPPAPSWQSVRDKLSASTAGDTAAASSAPGGGRRERRARVVVGAPKAAVAALIAIGLLAVPAFGAMRQVASWLTSSKDRDAPVPVASDVVLASGASGAAWEIVATPSNQGLCVFVRLDDRHGTGGCGPSDVRGDPAAGGAQHWVQGGNGSGGFSRLSSSIVHGWAAADVASVELIFMDGASVTAQMITTPRDLNGPAQFFWATLPCGSSQCVDIGVLVRSLVARDASNNVLETRDVHDPKATRSN